MSTSRRSLVDRPLGGASSPVLDVVVGAFVAGFGPVRRVTSIHGAVGLRPVALILIVLAGCVVLVVPLGRRRDRTAATAAVIAATAVLGAVPGGRIVGAWLLATMTLSAWVAMRRRLPMLGAFPRHGVLPIAASILLSGRAAGDVHALRLALVWFGVTVVLALVVRRWPALPAAVDRAVGPAVGAALTIVLLTPVWLTTVLVPWILQRVVGYDPLAPEGRHRARWIRRDSEAVNGDRLWLADPAADRPSFARRLHARAPSLLGAGLLVALVVGILAADGDLPNGSPAPTNRAAATLQETADFTEIRNATRGAVERIWFSHWVGNEWSDFTSGPLHIEDGRRRTWRPTDCPDRQLDVWVFGGSTTFGVHLSDDDTIPSALAKAAHDRGMQLHVQNWGMVGDVAWQEERRLERALAGEEAPDLVLFFDGWNDLRAVEDLDSAGRDGLDVDFIGGLDRLQMRALRDLAGIEPGKEYVVDVPDVGPTPSTEEAVAQASASYRHAHDMAGMVTGADGIPFVHVYQPNLLTRHTAVPEEPAANPEKARSVAAFRAALPEGVVDLGAALDGTTEPVYYDEVHTNELGSRAIAGPLLDAIWPALDQVATSTGLGRCG